MHAVAVLGALEEADANELGKLGVHVHAVSDHTTHRGLGDRAVRPLSVTEAEAEHIDAECGEVAVLLDRECLVG